ncbi:MAG: archease [Gemmataceae bacterium]
MFEFFDHTADLGLRIQSPDLNSLFEEAARAMFTAVVEDLSTIEDKVEVEIRIEGDEVDYLLFDWLTDLLIRFDADHMLFGKFEVEVTPTGMRGRVWGEKIDRSRHEIEHEVKAITYHGLAVEQTEAGWLAEIIVDI